jgi:hypothetical protein
MPIRLHILPSWRALQLQRQAMRDFLPHNHNHRSRCQTMKRRDTMDIKILTFDGADDLRFFGAPRGFRCDFARC